MNSFHFQEIGGKGQAADSGLRSDLIGTPNRLERLRRFEGRAFAKRAASAPLS